MPFYKKLNCDTKNEPPYLAITFTYVALIIDEVANVDNQNWVLVHHEYYALKDWWQILILLIIEQIVDGSYISNNLTNVLMHSYNNHWEISKCDIIKQDHVPFIVDVHCMVDCYNLIM